MVLMQRNCWPSVRFPVKGNAYNADHNSDTDENEVGGNAVTFSE